MPAPAQPAKPPSASPRLLGARDADGQPLLQSFAGADRRENPIGGGIKAFEIKRTARIDTSMLRGLRSFLKDYPMAQAYLVYGGNRRMREGNVEVYPVGEFLENLSSVL